MWKNHKKHSKYLMYTVLTGMLLLSNISCKSGQRCTVECEYEQTIKVKDKETTDQKERSENPSLEDAPAGNVGSDQETQIRKNKNSSGTSGDTALQKQSASYASRKHASEEILRACIASWSAEAATNKSPYPLDNGNRTWYNMPTEIKPPAIPLQDGGRRQTLKKQPRTGRPLQENRGISVHLQIKKEVTW